MWFMYAKAKTLYTNQSKNITMKTSGIAKNNTKKHSEDKVIGMLFQSI